MGTDFVAFVDDLLHLVGKGLDRMPRNEEGGLQSAFLEEPEQADVAYLAGEDAALYVGRRVATAVGADPAGDRVDVGPERTEDFLLGHFLSSHFDRTAARCN